MPASRKWIEADAYVFDIDGTLLNTRDLVHWNALNRAMCEDIVAAKSNGVTAVGVLLLRPGRKS